MTTTNQLDSSATSGEACYCCSGNQSAECEHCGGTGIEPAPQAATPSPGGQVDERALFSVAYAVRDWYKGQWPSHEGINGWNPPFAEIVSAAITQQDAPEAPARITFAHEVDGPWRLELNGVTISRHETRGELDRAIKALFAALNRKPPC